MTALIKKIVFPDSYQLEYEKIYPIGTILEFTDETDPNIKFAPTTWEKYGQGKFLIAEDETLVLATTGGKKGHKMTMQNLIKHSHNYSFISGFGTNGTRNYDPEQGIITQQTSETGQEEPEEIPTMPPYVVVARWERIA